MEFTVKFTWHDDEKIWLASSNDNNHGLTLDHNSFDGLLEKVKFVLYDIVENDFNYVGEVKIKLEIDCAVDMSVVAS